jgi:chaperonin cofactor prefoldin
MARRQRQLSEEHRWGASLVRAPQAGEVVFGAADTGVDEGGSDVRIIRSGPPAGVPHGPPTGPPDEAYDQALHREPANGASLNGFAYAGQNGSAEPVDNGAARPGRAMSLPASPQDHEGMHQALLWVAWAVEECSRAYTRVSSRVADVERRLADLESAQQVAGVAAATPPEPVGSSVDAWLEDLTSKLENHRAEMLSRAEGLDRRLRELDFVPLKLSNVQRDLDKLRSGQLAASKAAAKAATPPPPVVPTPSPDVARLSRQLKETQRRLEALDKRLGGEPLAVVVGEAVRVETERLTGELSNDKADVEGVYRELDSVAEFVAARAASTAESLERIGPLEIAVLELRRDVGRALAEPIAAQGLQEADRRLRDLDARFEALERTGRRVDRLYEALHGVIGQELTEAGPSGPAPADS